MNSPLYTVEILRLAASLPAPSELRRVDGASEQRSPTCGSTLRCEVQLDDDGRVEALSQEVHACAFGQAASALTEANAVGRSRDEVAAALEDFHAWLAGERDDPGSWPGLAALSPARSRRSRHGSMLLSLKALLAAMDDARR
jgi:NifU-like protein involved in Fe-S cluster formation